ncbi:hypothetical protein JCM8208_004645 [Rhodotorula glutinis]
MARRPRCTVCGSKRWHRDALSGSIVCDEGHLLQGYVHETTDTQEGPSQHTQTTRRLRKNKHKKHRPPSNTHFHGHRARFLHYQCIQLVLRHQLRTLIDDLGWPAELEPVARDLWQLVVASSNVEPTPADARRDDEPPGSYAGPRPGLRYARAGRHKYGPRGGGGAGRARGRGARGRDNDDDDEDSAGGDADAEREQGGENDTDGSAHSSSSSSASSSSSSAAGSGSDTESPGGQADDERPRADSRGPLSGPPSPAIPPLAPADPSSAFNPFTPPHRTASAASSAATKRERVARRVVDDPRDAPRLEFTLLIIYLSCMTLRLPVFLSDIFRLAESYQILYLDAAVHLPHDMQRHLDGSTRDALSPKAVPHLYSHTPSLERVRDEAAEVWLQRLVVLFRDDWGVHFPEANVPLLLGRVAEMLALPPLVPLLTLHLLAHLPGPPSFHLPTSSHTPAPSFWRARRDGGDGTGRREGEWPRMGKRLKGAMDWRGALPEVKVASLVVAVVRVLWRMDDEGEEGEGEGEAGEEEGGSSSRHDNLLPSRDAWLTAAEALAALDPPGDRSSLWRGEVSELDGDEMDAYLEWFEQHILSDEKVPSRFTDVARYFPAPEVYDPPRPQYGAEAYLDKVDRILEPLYGPRAAPPLPPSPQRNGAPARAAARANGFEPLFPPSSTPAPPTSSPLVDRRAQGAGDRSSSLPPSPSLAAAAGSNPPRPSPPSSAPPSHLPSVLPSYSRTHTLPLSTSPSTVLPSPLHRLLTLVAHHLTPAPLALPPALAGAAPRDDTRGVASLVPFVEQIEWVLERGLRGAGPSGPSELEREAEEVGEDGEDEVPEGPRRRTRARKGALVVDEREVSALERAGTLAAQAHASSVDPYMFEYKDGQLGHGGAGHGESEDEEEEDEESGTGGGSGSGTGAGAGSSEDEDEERSNDGSGSVRSTTSGRSGTAGGGLVNVRLIKTAEFITSSDDEEMDLDDEA